MVVSPPGVVRASSTFFPYHPSPFLLRYKKKRSVARWGLLPSGGKLMFSYERVEP
jgi:hypothetical protein